MVTRIPLLTGLFALALSATSQAQEPLRLLTFDIPPLVSEVEQGRPKGYAVRVLQRVFELAGDDYEMEFQPPKRAIQTATTTDRTCVFPIDRTQERETSLNWIGPVSISRHGLYAHPDRPVSVETLQEARGHIIGSYLGSGVGEYLQSQGFNVHLASKPYLGLLMLQAGRVDLWISDTRSAPIIARERGIELGDPELVFFTTLRSMGCNTNIGRERIEALENALQQLYRNGEMAAIIDLES